MLCTKTHAPDTLYIYICYIICTYVCTKYIHVYDSAWSPRPHVFIEAAAAVATSTGQYLCRISCHRITVVARTATTPGSLRWSPEGPSTQHLRTLVPKTIKGMVFGARVLKSWVLGPSGVVTWESSEQFDKPGSEGPHFGGRLGCY